MAGKVRKSVSVPANSTVTADLTPYAFMPGGGGVLRVAATVAAAGAGDVTASLQVGTERPANGILLGVERTIGGGPDGETPVFEALGAPSDPNLLEFTNTNVAARVVTFDVTVIF